MRNYRLQLTFSNHLYKNASQSNFETSEVLIRTWSQVLPRTRAGHWYSCLSALPCLHQISKTCRKYFRHLKMSKKVNTSMCMPLTKSIQVCRFDLYLNAMRIARAHFKTLSWQRRTQFSSIWLASIKTSLRHLIVIQYKVPKRSNCFLISLEGELSSLSVLLRQKPYGFLIFERKGTWFAYNLQSWIPTAL